MLKIVRLPFDKDAWEDKAAATTLSNLINDVYAVAERGLWVPGASRTSVEHIADFVRARQMTVAQLDGEIVGCLRIHHVCAGVGEFGMLAVDGRHRGTGIGRELVRFAEQTVRNEHCETMQLEVLVPRGWSHPSKDFLVDWYTRLGYSRARVGAVEDAYPEQAPLLATACDLVIYSKNLGPEHRRP